MRTRDKDNGCGFCQIFRTLACLSVLGIAGYVAWDQLGQPKTREDLLDILKDINVTDLINVLGNLSESDWIEGLDLDPHVGDNRTNVWINTDGLTGLTLTLQNALDDTWQQEYLQAVQDWDESDALTLSTETVPVDNFCTPVDGVMKVCNGNYGETGWLGINEYALQGNGRMVDGEPQQLIVNSVAKMNEYYLKNANYDQRLYTMCHEIGHGFGLPHTDENPYNLNLGNCLDYTTRPASNLKPGQVNFDRLQGMYRAVNNNNSTNRRLGNKAATAMAKDGNGNMENSAFFEVIHPKDDEKDYSRFLRGGRGPITIVRHILPVPVP